MGLEVGCFLVALYTYGIAAVATRKKTRAKANLRKRR